MPGSSHKTRSGWVSFTVGAGAFEVVADDLLRVARPEPVVGGDVEHDERRENRRMKPCPFVIPAQKDEIQFPKPNGVWENSAEPRRMVQHEPCSITVRVTSQRLSAVAPLSSALNFFRPCHKHRPCVS